MPICEQKKMEQSSSDVLRKKNTGVPMESIKLHYVTGFQFDLKLLHT